MLKKFFVLSVAVWAAQSFADPVCSDINAIGVQRVGSYYNGIMASNNGLALSYNQCFQYEQEHHWDFMPENMAAKCTSLSISPQAFNQTQLANFSMYQKTMEQLGEQTGCSTGGLLAPVLVDINTPNDVNP